MPGIDRERAPGVRPAVASGPVLALLVPFALLAVGVVGDFTPLRTLDATVTDRLHDYAVGHPGWVRSMAAWSWVFHPNVWRLAVLAVAVGLYRRGVRRPVRWMVATMALGGVLGGLLKLLFGRHRPDLPDPVALAAGYSFPSGHALNAALGAGVLVLVLLPVTRRGLRVALWVGAIVLPLITGVSRVALGVHFTSDVVGGWLLGIAVVAATAAVYDRWPWRPGGRRPPVASAGVEPNAAG